ncbi:MAG TPA: hypothetical protein VFY14_18930 [Streptomyces sp.]|nr:hypothetical protein [Streptomyces sp.]
MARPNQPTRDHNYEHALMETTPVLFRKLDDLLQLSQPKEPRP